MSLVKQILAERDRADQSFYSIKDIQDVSYLESREVPLADTKQYLKDELIFNHPNAYSYNREHAAANVDGVNSYFDLITLMLNTLRSFEQVKANGN